MNNFDLKNHPHRRLNLLTGEWILVSPHRAKRPWQGQIEKSPVEEIPAYDPKCYLCPGNNRAGGKKNPEYQQTFVFDNDFSALLMETPNQEWQKGNLLQAQGEPGICRVVCFSPRHDLTLPLMEPEDILVIIQTWTEQYQELGDRPEINHVQIFENKGLIMGCSNPHPHGQIWAQHSIPMESATELKQLGSYLNKNQSCLLCDYLKLEKHLSERIVLENDHFTALVPFWAVWPFEVLILSNRHYGSLLDLNQEEKKSLALILKKLTTRYDNLFHTSFPYSAGFHQSPTDEKDHPECHLHLHFYPPLLRSATVKKFMVGYEMLAEAQRDITPEWSADTLKNLSGKHWKG